MNTLPFNNVADIFLLDNIENNCTECTYDKMSSNNDFLINIDPDHNITRNGLEKQCKNYDTSTEFNNMCGSTTNISMLHSNICSSAKKITDFKYYINNFNLDIAFIGLSETWATKFNKDLLNIPGYRHEQCIRTNKKKGEGQVYIYTILYSIKKRRSFVSKNTLRIHIC